jgi:membrane-associated phospholipid phosphatase
MGYKAMKTFVPPATPRYDCHQIRKPWWFIALALSGFAIMIIASFFDQEISHWLRSRNLPGFAKFMDQSLFEGDSLGGSDIGVLFQIFAFLTYIWAEGIKKRSVLLHLRPFLGFFAFTSMTAGLLLVHTTKFVVGRARPYMLEDSNIPFTDWYEFGPLVFLGRWSEGSFPSGHTATSILLLAIVYAFGFSRSIDDSRGKLMTYVSGFIVLSFAIAMAVGRVMHFQHWFTDTLGSILFVWILIHISYFWLLFVPVQISTLKQLEAYPQLPSFWELRMIPWLVAMALGYATAIYGLRHLGRLDGLICAPLIIVGCGLLLFGAFRFFDYRKKILTNLIPK